MIRLFLQQLGKRGTLVTAAVVGTVINMYGQMVVPCLRGSGSAIDDLRRNFEDAPFLAIISIALGYTFPWLVSAFASARAKLEAAGEPHSSTLPGSH